MPLFKVTHNEDEAYVFADCLSDALERWAIAEARKTNDDPHGLEPSSIMYLADDEQIVANNEDDKPAYVGTKQ